MALKAFIKDLSEVGDTEQELYKQVDGGYSLDVEPVDGWDVQNVSNLRNALGKLKGDYEQAKTTLKSFGELDPKDVIRKLERYEKIKDMNPEKQKKELANDIRADIENQYKDKLSQADQKMQNLAGHLKKAAMGDIYALIAKEGGNPTIAKALVSQFADVEIGDNGYRLKILGENGKERFKISDNGDAVAFTPEDLVKDLQNHPDYGIIFPSQAKSGSGGQSSYKGGTGGDGVKYIDPSQENDYLEEIAAGKVKVR